MVVFQRHAFAHLIRYPFRERSIDVGMLEPRALDWRAAAIVFYYMLQILVFLSEDL